MHIPFSYKKNLVLNMLKNPDLLLVGIKQYFSFVPKKWYRKPFFLPVIPKEFINFRLETMYGKELPEKSIFVEDTIGYLRWCKKISDRAKLD